MAPRTNTYPGSCTDCGQTVAAETGTLGAKVDGRWTVTHGDCGHAPAGPAGYEPTDEQQTCIDLYRTGASMVIEAGAGTGKTAVLRMLAHATPDKRIQYVAFNKSIVSDVAGSMPSNVQANTAHSLAFAAVGRAYAKRLKSGRMRSDQIARRLDIRPLRLGDRTLGAGYLAGYVMVGIGRYCQTADAAPGTRHLPRIDVIDDPGEWANNNRVQDAMLDALHAAWADLTRTDGTLPFRHDHYLKIWQLSRPTLAADVILFDEAQDASPVMAAVIAEQTHAQVVYVGDAQQAIYEFTGAVNAIAAMKAQGLATAQLTLSFRFGPAIADQANGILADLDADLRVRGLDTIDSTVGDAPAVDAILTRTNACAVDAILLAQERGVAAHLVGGGAEVVRFAEAAADLQAGRSTQHPELACFDSWPQVLAYVEQDEQGDELALMVRLVERYTAPVIVRALGNMPTEAAADLIVSTAHKAKGREWDRVRLASDFVRETKGDEEPAAPTPSELRLRYVACTRARRHLDCTALDQGAPQ